MQVRKKIQVKHVTLLLPSKTRDKPVSSAFRLPVASYCFPLLPIAHYCFLLLAIASMLARSERRCCQILFISHENLSFRNTDNKFSLTNLSADARHRNFQTNLLLCHFFSRSICPSKHGSLLSFFQPSVHAAIHPPVYPSICRPFSYVIISRRHGTL